MGIGSPENLHRGSFSRSGCGCYRDNFFSKPSPVIISVLRLSVFVGQENGLRKEQWHGQSLGEKLGMKDGSVGESDVKGGKAVST